MNPSINKSLWHQSSLLKDRDRSQAQQPNQHHAWKPSASAVNPPHHVHTSYIPRLPSSQTVSLLEELANDMGIRAVQKTVGARPDIAYCWNVSQSHAKGMPTPMKPTHDRLMHWLYFHQGSYLRVVENPALGRITILITVSEIYSAPRINRNYNYT